MRKTSRRIPRKRLEEYIKKVKELLRPYDEEEHEREFYERKANELHLMEKVL